VAERQSARIFILYFHSPVVVSIVLVTSPLQNCVWILTLQNTMTSVVLCVLLNSVIATVPVMFCCISNVSRRCLRNPFTYLRAYTFLPHCDSCRPTCSGEPSASVKNWNKVTCELSKNMNRVFVTSRMQTGSVGRLWVMVGWTVSM